jgi:hypothetical protein
VNTAAKDYDFPLTKPLVYVGVNGVRVAVILVTLALIIWAVWQSKRTPTLSREAAEEARHATEQVPAGSAR